MNQKLRQLLSISLATAVLFSTFSFAAGPKKGEKKSKIYVNGKLVEVEDVKIDFKKMEKQLKKMEKEIESKLHKAERELEKTRMKDMRKIEEELERARIELDNLDIHVPDINVDIPDINLDGVNVIINGRKIPTHELREFTIGNFIFDELDIEDIIDDISAGIEDAMIEIEDAIESIDEDDTHGHGKHKQYSTGKLFDIMYDFADSHDHPKVRIKGVNYLSNYTDESKVVRLLEKIALRDDSLSVRKAAIDALRSSSEPKAREAYERIANTKN